MAVYQWFGVVYIIGCFFVIPILSIVIVLTNELVYWIIFYFIMSILIIVWIITGLQVKFREDYFFYSFHLFLCFIVSLNIGGLKKGVTSFTLDDFDPLYFLEIQKWKVSSPYSGLLELPTALVPQLGTL